MRSVFFEEALIGDGLKCRKTMGSGKRRVSFEPCSTVELSSSFHLLVFFDPPSYTSLTLGSSALPFCNTRMSRKALGRASYTLQSAVAGPSSLASSSSSCRLPHPPLIRSQTTSAAIAQAADEADHHQPLDPWNCFNYRASPDDPATAASTSTLTNVSDEQHPHDGPLAGWPSSIKDNICTKDMPTTASSRMLRHYRPSFDAACVAKLRQAGARIVGKTNLDEFGMGSDNIHTYFGPVINPVGRAHLNAQGRGSEEEAEPRACGGSSGGAMASIAAGLARVALGTDTGGSVRLPASYCGVWGFKPSYGLISRFGLVAYADSLDTVGIGANSWQDCETVFDILSGYDPRDPTSISDWTRKAAIEEQDRNLSRLSGLSSGSLEGLRIGIPAECFPAELNETVLPAFEEAVDYLESRGASVVPVTLPDTPLALSAYMVLSSAEASSNLARYDGVRFGYRSEDPIEGYSHPYAATRSQGFGEEVRNRILIGTHALSAGAFDNTFLRAQAIRKLVQSDFDSVFRAKNVLRKDTPTASAEKGVDVLLHPCAVNSAPTLEVAKHESSVEEYVQDLLTVPSSLAGLPAVSMPTGLARDGWPVGTMAVAQWGMEKVLAVVGKAMDEYKRR